jgi:hypothetical protein
LSSSLSSASPTAKAVCRSGAAAKADHSAGFADYLAGHHRSICVLSRVKSRLPSQILLARRMRHQDTCMAHQSESSTFSGAMSIHHDTMSASQVIWPRDSNGTTMVPAGTPRRIGPGRWWRR